MDLNPLQTSGTFRPWIPAFAGIAGKRDLQTCTFLDDRNGRDAWVVVPHCQRKLAPMPAPDPIGGQLAVDLNRLGS
jgi:hypothetical protein